MLYSYGPYAWRLLGIQLHVYTALRAFSSLKQALENQMAYSARSVFFFGLPGIYINKFTLDEKILKEKIDSMSLTELKAAVTEFSSYYVYVANYTIDDTANIVTHERITCTIPSIWGT